MLRPDDKLHFFTSPYRRTRETTEGILATLTSDEREPSPFRRSNIKVYEEPRLREQDFGNFQPCSAEMERMWQERADYGHFFYRIPNGESAADAYDRVSGFNESLWRQFGEDDFASVCVLVTHGLMSRVFLMKWYHFTVEYFEDLRNVDHCEFLIMRKEDNGKFTLDTKLRTWSELKRERAALKSKDKEKDRDGETQDDDAAAVTKLPRNKTFVVTRRWGGCPNGCNHTNYYKKRQDLDALRQRETERAAESSISRGTSPHDHRHSHHHHRRRRGGANVLPSSDDEGEDEDHVKREEDNDQDGPAKGPAAASGDDSQSPPPVVAVTGTTQKVERILPQTASGDVEVVNPITKSPQYQHLHMGRDFGGSYSGHTSIAGSDSDSVASHDDDDDIDARLRRHAGGGSSGGSGSGSGTGGISSLNDALHPDSRILLQERHHLRNLSVSSAGSTAPSGPGPFVNRLGDAPAMGISDSETEPVRRRHATAAPHGRAKKEDADKGLDEDLEAAEARDKSIRGSVY